jgi:hypothetical protein
MYTRRMPTCILYVPQNLNDVHFTTRNYCVNKYRLKAVCVRVCVCVRVRAREGVHVVLGLQRTQELEEKPK